MLAVISGESEIEFGFNLWKLVLSVRQKNTLVLDSTSQRKKWNNFWVHFNSCSATGNIGFKTSATYIGTCLFPQSMNGMEKS